MLILSSRLSISFISFYKFFSRPLGKRLCFSHTHQRDIASLSQFLFLINAATRGDGKEGAWIGHQAWNERFLKQVPCKETHFKIRTPWSLFVSWKVQVGRRQRGSGACKTTADMFISTLKLCNWVSMHEESRPLFFFFRTSATLCFEIEHENLEVEIITLEKCAFDNSAFYLIHL